MSGSYGGVLALVTAAAEEPVSRVEAKLWLRIDEHDVSDDDLVDALVKRARMRWEEARQRSALIQTFDYYLDESPDSDEAICLPKAPLVSVTSIKGYANTEATDSGGTAMSTSGYYVDTAHEFGRVKSLSAFTYPVATREINPVIIRFTAGYSSGSTGVPETVKTEIKQLVAKLYEHRGDELDIQKELDAYGGVADLDLPSWG